MIFWVGRKLGKMSIRSKNVAQNARTSELFINKSRSEVPMNPARSFLNAVTWSATISGHKIDTNMKIH